MKLTLGCLLIVAVLVQPQGGQKYTGTISDDMCPAGDHSRMRMGSNDAECTIACKNAHAALYVLFDGKQTYALSDQKSPEKFAGKKVTVTGTLNTKTMTIEVRSIAATN
jgi:hypothetical protein